MKSHRLVPWVVSLAIYPGAALVAQVSNLLYRGFPIRIGSHARTGCRLEVGDTAGWKPALRQCASAHACWAFQRGR